MLKRVAFLMLLVAMFSASIFTTNGCAGATDPTPTDATLSGRVIDADSRAPLEGAQVTVQSVTRTTDAQGRFAIGGLTPGTVTVVVSHAGYETQQSTLGIHQGVNNIELLLRRR